MANLLDAASDTASVSDDEDQLEPVIFGVRFQDLIL